jgi:hypothetical protein
MCSAESDGMYNIKYEKLKKQSSRMIKNERRITSAKKDNDYQLF